MSNTSPCSTSPASPQASAEVVTAPVDNEGADFILPSSDGVQDHVHRLLLGLASPVLNDMFSLTSINGNNTTDSASCPSIQLRENSVILQAILSRCDRRTQGEFDALTLPELFAALAAADKYQILGQGSSSPSRTESQSQADDHIDHTEPPSTQANDTMQPDPHPSSCHCHCDGGFHCSREFIAQDKFNKFDISSKHRSPLPHSDEERDLKSLIALALDEVDAYDEQIGRLTNLLISLKSKRRTLSLSLERAESLLQPIHQLPREVLAQIFKYAGRFISFGEKVSIPLLNCAHVCSSWHDVTMTTPSLWSRLDIDLASSHSSALEWVLRNSGSSRLGIYLALSEDNIGSLCQSLLELLITQSSRWHHLSLSVPLSFIRTSLASIHSNLSELYSLDIALETLEEPSELASEQSVINAFEVAPNLRELVGGTLLLRHFTFPWAQIIRFEMPGRLEPDYQGDNSRLLQYDTLHFPLDDVRESFMRMPNAMSAYIRQITTPAPSESDDEMAVRHDKITMLTINIGDGHVVYLQPMGQFLSRLEAPRLRVLMLYSQHYATLDQWHCLSNALTTNTSGLLSGLVTLNLHFSAISISSLTKILVSCIPLRRLALVEYKPTGKQKYQEQKMNEVVDLLTVAPSESDILVPNLQSIAINTCSGQFNLQSFTRMISSRRTNMDDQAVGVGLRAGIRQLQKLTSVTLNVRRVTLNKRSQDILDLVYVGLGADDLTIHVQDKTGTVIGENFRWVREQRVRSSLLL
jgi:hypothetical protein